MAAGKPVTARFRRSQVLDVSNIFEWDEKVDSRIYSRAQSNKLIFPPYSEEEIFNVLKFIRAKALNSNVMNDKVLRIVTKHTKDVFLGDIRKGKNLISLAVKKAQNEGSNIVNSLFAFFGLILI